MTVVWTDSTIQTFLKKPQTLLTKEPWKTWIAQQGGLQAVYAAFAAFPLPEQERQVLNLMLAKPGLTHQQYAVMLSMHRVTFQRTLRRLVSTLTAHIAAPRRAAPPPEHSATIPAPLTALIGRAEEVAAICTLLQNPATRLLTLVGTGGIGKTRLAIQIAQEISAEYPDGVVFVSLTPIADSALVMPAIAHALGIQDNDSQDLTAQLQRYCAPRKLCLIIDNAEHVLAAAPAFSALLRQAPRLVMLVTSRVRLDLYGEHVISVPALALPPRDTAMPFEHVCGFDALRLFAARAQAVDHSFQLASENVELVQAICTSLDGLPLAIELAAAHLRYYPLREIMTRLEHRLAFLNNGPRDVDPRHQTLLATIGWSETLLEPAVRQVFRRLSVLVDGWTLAALAGVCGLAEAECEAILHTLLDHHLAYRLNPASDERRFGMLETIREYALRQLRESDEEAAIRSRHAQYYVNFVEPTEGKLGGEQQLPWLATLNAAYPNIRAALAWLLEAGPVQSAVQLGGALWRYWELTAQYMEGRNWLDHVMQREGADANTRHYARGLQSWARTYLTTGNIAQAISINEQALEISRQTDDRWRTASILSDIGVSWRGAGDSDRAEAYYLQSLALRREVGDQSEIGGSLVNLGTLAFMQGDYLKARDFYQQGLELFRRVGDSNGVAIMLNNLGAVARNQEDYAAAEQVLLEALVVRKQIGHLGGVITTIVNLAWVCAAQGKIQQSRQYLSESVPLQADLADESHLDAFSEVFTLICLAEADVEAAMEWFGVAEQELLRINAHREPTMENWYKSTLASAEAQLGVARVAAARARHQTLTPAEAMATLLTCLRENRR